jgi:hypothetical protein
VCAKTRAREPEVCILVDGVIITGIRSLLTSGTCLHCFPFIGACSVLQERQTAALAPPFLYSAVSFVNSCHLFEYFIQTLNWLTTGWTVRRSNPDADENFRTCPDWPWDSPSLLYNGYRVFPGGRKRPRRDAYHSPPSSTVVKKQIRAIPLLFLRDFVACKKGET